MVRGKGLFSGYYKNDIATQESFDSDGWLHTGDIGAIDKDGYLTIQGRKRHVQNRQGQICLSSTD